MMVLVGPDVPEEIAKEIGRRHQVYYSHTTYPGHGPRELLGEAGRHGFGAIVTNDPAIKQAAQKEQKFGGFPTKVIAHEGHTSLPRIQQELSDHAKTLGLSRETLSQRLSQDRRHDNGLRRNRP